MPGLAQVAPAFSLFFATGVMVGLAGASAPLIFLIPMVGNALPWLTLGLIAVGVAYPLILGAWQRRRVLEQAPALLGGEESLASDPLPIGG